jgi:hypothetical protein
MIGETAEKVATERPMRMLRDAMYPKTAPTPKQDQAIREVWAMAAEFALLPPERRAGYLVEVRKQTNGRQRWLATRHTPPDNPNFAPLMALLDALIDGPGAVHTKHGIFMPDDLHAAEAKTTREEIAFPVRYPWRVKPDDEKGVKGERLPAIYRSQEERAAGPRLMSFRVVPRPDDEEKGDWWDK